MALSRPQTTPADAISSCQGNNMAMPLFAFTQRLFFVLAMVCTLVLASAAVLAQETQPDTQPNTDEQAQLIAGAEAWLNSVSTLTADFTQRTDKGDQSQGKFYLQRPYRTRFAYDAPGDLILITTETWLHVEDTKREDVTSYPVGQTLLRHLLQPTPRLTAADEGIVTTTSRDLSSGPENSVVLIRLSKATGDDAGMLVLAFQENPFGLLGWTITDAIGTTTQIILSNIALGAELAPRLFIPSDYTQDPQK